MFVLPEIRRALPALALPFALALSLVPAPIAAQSVDASALTALKWRELGPARGGRSVAVAGSDARPMEYWMGTTGGGVLGRFTTAAGGEGEDQGRRRGGAEGITRTDWHR